MAQDKSIMATMYPLGAGKVGTLSPDEARAHWDEKKRREEAEQQAAEARGREVHAKVVRPQQRKTPKATTDDVETKGE